MYTPPSLHDQPGPEAVAFYKEQLIANVALGKIAQLLPPPKHFFCRLGCKGIAFYRLIAILHNWMKRCMLCLCADVITDGAVPFSLHDFKCSIWKSFDTKLATRATTQGFGGDRFLLVN